MRAFVTGGSGFVGGRLIRALARRGDAVVGLARSDGAARAVLALGAEAARGDLDDVSPMQKAMAGADVVFHAAALTAEHAPEELWTRVNVQGTANVLEAARRARVPRVVHLSTEAVLLDGSPLVRVDESRPVPARPLPGYPASKAAAERAVVAANGDGVETVVVRPRFVWGDGDTSLLPKLVEAVHAGRFAWIGGGRHLTSTCHVDNVVEGCLLAASKGRPGAIYFLTDGEPVVVREHLSAMLATRGATPGDRTIPFPVAKAAAVLAEAAWGALRLSGAPPATRTAVELIGREVTVVDDKARAELGYASSTTREAGLAAMRAEAG